MEGSVSHRRHARAIPAVVRPCAALAVGAILACLALAPAVLAQSGTSVHLAIEGGPDEGTYELSTAESCRVFGDGNWLATIEDPSASPSSIRIDVGGFAPVLSVAGWPTGGGYYFWEFEHQVAESAGDATIIITAHDPDYGDDSVAVTVRVTVECRGFADERTAAPTPEPTLAPVATPAAQGPPPEGSTTVALSLDFGPWAGDHVSWTLEDACFVSDGSWMVTVHDALTIPSDVTLIAAAGTPDDPPIGLFGADFGSSPEIVRYETSGTASFALDDHGHATVSDAAAVAFLPDGTTAHGTLTADLRCARIVP
jgi:hypothetical protein